MLPNEMDGARAGDQSKRDFFHLFKRELHVAVILLAEGQAKNGMFLTFVLHILALHLRPGVGGKEGKIRELQR